MTYLQSAFLGLVQGIAEFLPISSSGHLSLFQNFLGLQSAEEASMFFDVLLHLGTLIAVFAVYWKDIWEMILEFFRWIGDLTHGGTKGKPVPPARRMILLIIVGTLPLFLVLPIKDAVDSLYSNTYFIGFALLVTGTLLFVSDRMAHGKKTEKTATVVDALVVGCAQGLATVPGLSRSGTTIAAGLLRGYKREFAVRYSFLMSIPAVIGANILSLKDALEAGIDAEMVPVYLVGVLVAAVSGYFAIRLVNLLSDKGRFGAFAYYCWGVGVLALVLSFVL
ncbi:MAG: undecaprenyl-diphosphate phosphatase [Clostridiales bacterium]|nr:undecaprenyl-diphosphate phosphatase [Clostridiales bacterium]